MTYSAASQKHPVRPISADPETPFSPVRGEPRPHLSLLFLFPLLFYSIPIPGHLPPPKDAASSPVPSRVPLVDSRHQDSNPLIPRFVLYYICMGAPYLPSHNTQRPEVQNRKRAHLSSRFLFPSAPNPSPQKAEVQMEQFFAGSSFVSHLLEELVGLRFYSPLLSWVSRIQKLYLRYLSFLLPLFGFVAVVWRIQEDEDTREESRGKVKAQRRREEDVVVSRRDVEMVMARMGLGCGSGGGELKGVVGAEDLNCLFEDKEPSLEEVKEAFRVFDRNRDGFIDAAELQTVLSLLGFKEGLSVDDCRRMIGSYDENGDGRIDFHEFVKFMESSFC
ncbi:hypothetical protein Taro_056434 [Colocasia esculenta]|uniref:EF-hand domain-containing protein n=1 Tax=Colocasia esculenta TaxID=4460 RepID=A0A843XWN3_COLES|nr:hypothetical protein [Colocasia esculenta]